MIFETVIAVFADNQVIKQLNSHRMGRNIDFIGNIQIGMRRRHITRRMIMNQNNGSGSAKHCRFNNFARMNRNLINRSPLLNFFPDNLQLGIKKNNPKLLHIPMADWPSGNNQSSHPSC